MTDGVIMITSSRDPAGRRSGRRVSARCASGLGESKVTASTARNERRAPCASREGVATKSSRMAAGRRAAQFIATQYPAARQMGAAAGPDAVDAVEDGWLVRHRTRRDDDLGGLVEGDDGEGVFAAEVLHGGLGGAEGRGQGFAAHGTAAVEHERKGNGVRGAPSEAKKGAPDGALGGPRQVRPCAAHLVGPKPHREYECLAPTRENPWCFSSPINSLGSAPSPIRWRRAV